MAIVISTLLLLASAWFDAKGFVYATQSWNPSGTLNLKPTLLTAIFFIVGLTLYFFSVRFMTVAGAASTTMQSLLWFFATIAGIAILSGDFVKWNAMQYIAVIMVVAGMSYLLATVGH